MIVIEGPDRAGKTTLSKLIAKDHGSDVRHLAGSKIVDRTVIRHWGLVEGEMWEFTKTQNRNVIYDRMVIGSMVYSFKKDIHNILPVTLKEYGEWLQWLAATKTVLICALPPLEVILDRMDDGEIYITKDEMIQIYESYQRIFAGFMGHSPIQILFYDSAKTAAANFYVDNYHVISEALK